jgi:hypothetical protein
VFSQPAMLGVNSSKVLQEALNVNRNRNQALQANTEQALAATNVLDVVSGARTKRETVAEQKLLAARERGLDRRLQKQLDAMDSRLEKQLGVAETRAKSNAKVKVQERVRNDLVTGYDKSIAAYDRLLTRALTGAKEPDPETYGVLANRYAQLAAQREQMLNAGIRPQPLPVVNLPVELDPSGLFNTHVYHVHPVGYLGWQRMKAAGRSDDEILEWLQKHKLIQE